MKKETIKYERIYFKNRWKEHKYSRNCDWTIIGVSKWWCSPYNFCYKLCFFGLEVHIWFNRTIHK
jgi:hypothetical protein